MTEPATLPDVDPVTFEVIKHRLWQINDEQSIAIRLRSENVFVRRFQIGDGNGIDGTEDTDGIDVTTADLGAAFADGLFVAQDGDNDGGNQNYKLVPWNAIIGAP